MPAYAPDRELLHAITGYVNDVHGGVIKRAAKALDLDYIMLRRFLGGGKAKPENRQRIRNALEAAGWGVAKDHKISQDISIGATRSMLTQLLQALDVYEHSADASGAMKP